MKDDLIRRGDALAAIFEAINKVAHAQDFTPLQIQMAKRRYEKAIAAVPAVNDDRIEALEKRLDATKNKSEAAMLVLMSNLGKVVEALRAVLATAHADDHVGWQDALKDARATLAEIEGGGTHD